MRSNKGISLTSLIIYVIVFTIVVATVTTISGYFMKNTDEVVISANSAEQYNRFITYLSNDINSVNFKSATVTDNKAINITFVDGLSHIYIYSNNNIYFISTKDETIDKKITLCKKVESYNFLYENNKLKISVTIEGITYNNHYSI